MFGSVTKTVYDNKQRMVSTVERTAGNVVISGFTYTYDALDRIVKEAYLAEHTNVCYTHDNLGKVTKRTVKYDGQCYKCNGREKLIWHH